MFSKFKDYFGACGGGTQMSQAGSTNMGLGHSPRTKCVCLFLLFPLNFFRLGLRTLAPMRVYGYGDHGSMLYAQRHLNGFASVQSPEGAASRFKTCVLYLERQYSKSWLSIATLQAPCPHGATKMLTRQANYRKRWADAAFTMLWVFLLPTRRWH